MSWPNYQDFSVPLEEIPKVKEEVKEEDSKPTKSKNVVAFEKYEDFSKNCFKVTISRIQQVALKKAASSKLPTPGEQLELIQKRREAKSKGKAAIPSWFMLNLIRFFNIIDESQLWLKEWLFVFLLGVTKEVRFAAINKAAGWMDSWDPQTLKRQSTRAKL